MIQAVHDQSTATRTNRNPTGKPYKVLARGASIMIIDIEY